MEACAWQGIGHGVDPLGHLLEAVICITGNLSAYVGRGYPRQCIQAGYWVAFKQPVSIYTY